MLSAPSPRPLGQGACQDCGLLVATSLLARSGWHVDDDARLADLCVRTGRRRTGSWFDQVTDEGEGASARLYIMYIIGAKSSVWRYDHRRAQERADQKRNDAD